MTVLPLLAASFIIYVVRTLFIICAVVLVLVILIQKGKGGGLSAAFGGAGGAGGVLGTKTGDFLTWFTIGLVALFLLLAVVEAKFDKPFVSDFDRGPSVSQQLPPAQPQPLSPAVPGGTATEANLPGN